MKKYTGYVLALLLLGLGLGSIAPTPVLGDALSDLDAQNQAIATQQNQLNDQLNAQMAVVSSQTIKTNQLQQQLNQTQQQLHYNQRDLTLATKRLAQRRQAVKKRLRAIQRQGPTPNLIQAVLQANSLTQLSQAVYVIKTVQQADDLAIHNVAVSLKALKTTQANLLTKQAQLVAQQQQLDQAKAQLQTDLTHLKQLMAQNQTQMAQLTAQKEALIQQIEQEAKAKAQEQAQAQAAADQQRSNTAAIFSGNGLNLTPSGPTATGVKISFYDPAVLGSTMGYNGVAANLAVYPKGTKLKIVFADGTTIHRVVNDTGTFVYTSPNQIDVAWPNAAIPSYGITSATVTVES
ncbi:hypothetical protein FC83_GL000163 [Agrilactobacillus composti DSM 18527 = JCM 14202]|uniref:Peptidoglycan hydrolase PcsB coiled-coil domain-containing protein n=1 Tax=Agrilactobacillus composti DSM 18527 = JCM 14202 TaxID=1423734 RepID=A0A0R1XRN4_9LACO|nr:hypothetical protein [Agrilactobacillus composti]KRM32879.1 hypothetical protein FC83_GL000163 [Agrilactobacillus composti DSM 18527 = JCM 14202]